MKETKKNQNEKNILFFFIPSLLIFISIVAAIYGITGIEELKNYANAVLVAVILFWFPISVIIINFLIIIYGVIKLDCNTYAKTSFILSLFFLIPAINLFTSILSVIYGFIALKDIKKEKQKKGKALALSGILISLLIIIVSLIGLFLASLYPEFLKP